MHRFKIVKKLTKQKLLIQIEISKKTCKIIMIIMLNSNIINYNNLSKSSNRTKIIKSNISKINKAPVKNKTLTNKAISSHQVHLF